MFKYKELVLKFSYPKLQDLCQEKGWEIPTIKELKENDYFTSSDHEWVWVSDEPSFDNEDGTRAVLYNKLQDRRIQINKNWKENCIIKKRIGSKN